MSTSYDLIRVISMLKYLRMTVTEKNYSHEENKSRLNVMKA